MRVLVFPCRPTIPVSRAPFSEGTVFPGCCPHVPPSPLLLLCPIVWASRLPPLMCHAVCVCVSCVCARARLAFDCPVRRACDPALIDQLKSIDADVAAVAVAQLAGHCREAKLHRLPLAQLAPFITALPSAITAAVSHANPNVRHWCGRWDFGVPCVCVCLCGCGCEGLWLVW